MEGTYPAWIFIVGYLALMLGIGLILSLIDFAQRRYRFTLKNLLLIWTVYTLDWGLRLLLYVLAVPLILLLFLLQPVLALAFLIALILLLIYGIGLFYEQPIVGNPPSSQEAIWALCTLAGCLLIWLLAVRVFKSENALYDRYADFFVKKVHHPVQGKIRALLKKLDV